MTLRATLFALSLVAVFPASARGDSVDAVLDALHAAGAASDPAAFLMQLAPDAVVLGMHGSGKLAGAALHGHVNGRFAAGDGWSYHSTGRTTRYSTDRNMAWFTESLQDSGGGHSWGSGVLIVTVTGWKIAQYALTGPLPAGADAQSPPREIAGKQERERCRRMRHKTNKVSDC